MKFYLVKREPLDMSFGHVLRGQNGHTVRRLVLPATISPMGNSKEEKLFCEKVNLKLSQLENSEKFDNPTEAPILQQKQKELIFSIATVGSGSLKGFVGIADGYGDILQKLTQVFNDETLKVELVVTNFRDREQTSLVKSEYVLTKELDVVFRHNLKVYASEDAEFQFGSESFVQKFKEEDALLGGVITVVCRVDDSALPCTSCQPKLEVYKRLLHEEICSDAEIIGRDGIGVKCHRSILSVQSPVLKAAFASDMAEGHSGTVEILDMTDEKSVKAFLAWLYCGEVVEAQSSCQVAFDLFHAGHKYDIPALEKRMEELLMNKPFAWFDLEVTLKLYLFVRNLPKYSGEGSKGLRNCRNDLKLKSVEIIRLNLSKVEKLASYQQLFQDEPKAAMELCKIAFASADE